MGKIKLYELAKDLDLTSKELLEKAGEIGITLKSHLSVLSDEDVEKIKKAFSKNETAGKAKQKEEKKENKTVNNAKLEKDTPVIIRREVIIEDENKKQEEKSNKQPQNKNPFVERQNKDYNIVYRNRPEKPKTVSELFPLPADCC